MERVLTKKFTCIGCQHRQEAVESFRDMDEDDMLITLELDPQNEYDNTAIKVVAYDYEDKPLHIGFLANDQVVKASANAFIIQLTNIRDNIVSYTTEILKFKTKDPGDVLQWFEFQLTVRYN